MARIRSIKPEMRTSLVAAEWPREVRYAWILLWGYLDDHGRGVDNTKLLTADLFPLDDDVDAPLMDQWLQLMANAGSSEDPDKPAPLCRYQVGGRRYLHATNWAEHQKPSHPTPSRIPPCPHHECGEKLANPSGEAPEELRPEQVRGAGSREQGGGTRETAPPAGASSTTELPPDRCFKHRTSVRPPACGRCKDARRAHERALAEQSSAAAAALDDLRARRAAVPWCGAGNCDEDTRWRDLDDATLKCPECHPDLVVGPMPRPLAAVAGAR